MTNQTTENFLQAWADFKWPDPVVPSYRLYYNQDGTPKCYSMEHLLDKYVEVDAETFALRPWNVRVVDDKIVLIQPAVQVHKLKTDHTDGMPCHPHDVCVVVTKQQPNIKWKRTINEVR